MVALKKLSSCPTPFQSVFLWILQEIRHKKNFLSHISETKLIDHEASLIGLVFIIYLNLTNIKHSYWLVMIYFINAIWHCYFNQVIIIVKTKHGCVNFHTYSASVLVLDCEQRKLSWYLIGWTHVVMWSSGVWERRIRSFIFHRGKQGTMSYWFRTQWSGRISWKWGEEMPSQQSSLTSKQ